MYAPPETPVKPSSPAGLRVGAVAFAPPSGPGDDGSGGRSMGGEAAFLSRYPPFRTLDADRLEAVVAGLRTQSYPAAATILKRSGDPAGSLFVIREGIVDLLDEDRVIDHLGEGELFGISVLSGMGPALSVRARTPAVCYLIDPDLAREVMGSSYGCATHAGVVDRLLDR